MWSSPQEFDPDVPELRGRVRPYQWGSTSAILGLLGKPPAEGPVAEVWLGAHPDGPASVGVGTSIVDDSQLYPPRVPLGSPSQLFAEWIVQDPQVTLGESVVERYGAFLPYLLGVIASAEPLSLRVHPSIEQAEEGFATEEAVGVPRSASDRNYKDRNHKPELAYAFTTSEVLVGSRARRRTGGVLRGLDMPLAQRLRAVLGMGGVRGVFEYPLREQTRLSPEEVAEVVEVRAARSAADSPSARADRVAVMPSEHYPGDPGVVASLLMNSVTLSPGEMPFLSAGTVHACFSGVAAEIMATLDSVLRAGLIHKHVDAPELLVVLNSSVLPPTRTAPEHVNAAVFTFYAPVDDFELSEIRLGDANTRVRARGIGPRAVLCLRGVIQLEAGGRARSVIVGQVVFVPASDGQLTMRGIGHLVQAAVS